MFAELEKLKALNAEKQLQQTEQGEQLRAMQLELGEFAAEAQEN